MINPVNFSGMEKQPINTNEKIDSKQNNKIDTNAEQEAYIVDIKNTPEKKATYDNPGVVKPDIKKIEQLKSKQMMH